MITVSSFIGVIGTLVISLVAWGARTEKRISVVEKSHGDLKEFIEKLMDAKFETVNTSLDAQSDRLARIERSMNGHLIKE